jgi:fatty acid desaturase
MAPWLMAFGLYLAFCSGVLSHYHNHRGVFRSARLNRIYSVWLSIFYGFPLWAWVPTHNQNHHKYNNGVGDITRVTATDASDNIVMFLSYPWRSSSAQLLMLRKTWSHWQVKNSAMFKLARLQSVVVPTAHLSLLLIFSLRHGSSGAVAYLICGAVPALFAPWSMMFINYIQHVGCDPASSFNHSRNFVSPAQNWFVFDAGLHTVHHEAPGVHWSSYREMHMSMADAIDPSLNQHDLFAFLWRRYVRQKRVGVSSHLHACEKACLVTRGQASAPVVNRGA